MDKANLADVPVAALESLRLRLTQLTHSLNNLVAQLKQPSLPSWPVIQGQFNVIVTQLASLSGTLSNHAEVLQRTVAYPLPGFPTVVEQNLLTTLLRKKNLPEVDEWMSLGRQESKDTIIKQDDQFCKWASEVLEQHGQQHEWTGFQTRAQISAGEAVRGLKRDEEGPGYSVDEMLLYLSKGVVKDAVINT